MSKDGPRAERVNIKPFDREPPLWSLFLLNPLTASAAYIRVFVFD